MDNRDDNYPKTSASSVLRGLKYVKDSSLFKVRSRQLDLNVQKQVNNKAVSSHDALHDNNSLSVVCSSSHTESTPNLVTSNSSDDASKRKDRELASAVTEAEKMAHVKAYCYSCDSKVVGNEILRHLFFGSLGCKDCALKILNCESFFDLYNSSEICKKTNRPHNFSRWASDPVQYVSYRVHKDYVIKRFCNNITQPADDQEISMAITNYMNSLQITESLAPWKFAIPAVKAHLKESERGGISSLAIQDLHVKKGDSGSICLGPIKVKELSSGKGSLPGTLKTDLQRNPNDQGSGSVHNKSEHKENHSFKRSLPVNNGNICLPKMQQKVRESCLKPALTPIDKIRKQTLGDKILDPMPVDGTSNQAPVNETPEAKPINHFSFPATLCGTKKAVLSVDQKDLEPSVEPVTKRWHDHTKTGTIVSNRNNIQKDYEKLSSNNLKSTKLKTKKELRQSKIRTSSSNSVKVRFKKSLCKTDRKCFLRTMQSTSSKLNSWRQLERTRQQTDVGNCNVTYKTSWKKKRQNNQGFSHSKDVESLQSFSKGTKEYEREICKTVCSKEETPEVSVPSDQAKKMKSKPHCKGDDKSLKNSIQGTFVLPKQLADERYLVVRCPNERCPDECPDCYCSLYPSMVTVNCSTSVLDIVCPNCSLTIYVVPALQAQLELQKRLSSKVS